MTENDLKLQQTDEGLVCLVRVSHSIPALNEEVYDVLSHHVEILVQEFMHLSRKSLHEVLNPNKY